MKKIYSNYLNYLLNLHVCMYTLSLCAGPERSEVSDPWNLSYWWLRFAMWVLGAKLQEQQVLLTLQPPNH